MDHSGPPGRRQHPSCWQLQPGSGDWEYVRTVKLISGEEDPSDLGAHDNIFPDEINYCTDNIFILDETIDKTCQVDGNPNISTYDNICLVDGIPDKAEFNVTNICQLDGNVNLDSVSYLSGDQTNSYQSDGGDSFSLESNSSTHTCSSDEEIDSEPVRAVLVPAQPSDLTEPFCLEVGNPDIVQAPSSLPLTMIANFRSAYNKPINIKKILMSSVLTS